MPFCLLLDEMAKYFTNAIYFFPFLVESMTATTQFLPSFTDEFQAFIRYSPSCVINPDNVIPIQQQFWEKMVDEMTNAIEAESEKLKQMQRDTNAALVNEIRDREQRTADVKDSMACSKKLHERQLHEYHRTLAAIESERESYQDRDDQHCIVS